MKKIHRYSVLLIIFTVLLTNCKTKKQEGLPGYIQGKFTYISSYYSGTLKNLRVNPGDTVTQGQALFTLEPYPENMELTAANARVQQAIDEKNKHEASFLLQKANNERNLLLFKKKVISKEELEQSVEALHTALASKNAADANLAAEQANQNKATWITQQKTVTAPLDALVFDTYYTEHEKVEEGKPVLSLLAPNAIKIIFFIPQQRLSSLRLKQNIKVFSDGSKEPIDAKISYISPKEEYTPPVIYSEMERQQLVFRVEATPAASESFLKIHPGQPVTVILDNNNS